MSTTRMVSNDLLPPGVQDREAEAVKHPAMVGDFTHWSSPGWDEKRGRPAVILTFDPECPRCREVSGKEEVEK